MNPKGHSTEWEERIQVADPKVWIKAFCCLIVVFAIHYVRKIELKSDRRSKLDLGWLIRSSVDLMLFHLKSKPSIALEILLIKRRGKRNSNHLGIKLADLVLRTE